MTKAKIKLVLLGEGRVGKTSLSSRFVSDSFNEGQVYHGKFPAMTTDAYSLSTSVVLPHHLGGLFIRQGPTSAAAFLTKRIEIRGCACELAIWDTAGQERFHSLGPIYYRNADAAILVFDVTDAGSFRRVRDWVRELRQMVGPDIPLSIVANKQDLKYLGSEGGVPDDHSRGFAASVGATYCRTSARTGSGIEHAFMCTAKEALAYHKRKQADIPQGRQNIGMALHQPPGGGTTLNQQRQSAPNSSCC